MSSAAIEMMLGSVYDLSRVRLDHITSATVTDVALQTPLYALEHHRGNWTQNIPSYVSTDVSLDTRSSTDPIWVDLLARVRVNVVVEVDPVGIDTVTTREVGDFADLDAFRAQFRFLDLDEFMRRHHLVTVEDLRDSYDYLITEIRLRKPGVFDPTDPANAHDVELDLAVLVRDEVDLVGALRDASSVRALADRTRALPQDGLLGTADSAIALAVVLDEAALTAAGLRADAVSALFARAQVLGLVADPP